MISTRMALAALLIAASSPALAFEPFVSMAGEGRNIHPIDATDEVLATVEQTDGQLGIIILSANGKGDGPGPAIMHSSRAEYFYVLEGHYEFHLGDKVFDGGPGTFIAIPPGTVHGYISKAPGRIMAIFNPGGYEHFFMDWAKQGLVPGPELGKLENQYGLTRKE